MNSNQKEPVYIIIPVHNRKNITLKCLETLKQCGDLDQYYTVVVDDGSTDGTSEAITNLYSEVTILTGDGNLWWTGAIRKGMEYAYERGAECFIWLNDDCQPTKDALSQLVDFIKDNSKTIIGCQGVELDNPQQICFGGKEKKRQGHILVQVPPNHLIPCDLLCGNLVCLPRTSIEEIGFPNPQITPHYHGDSWYSVKAKQAGFQLFLDTRNPVFNRVSEGSKLYPGKPSDWLLYPGHPFNLLKLVFIPQSGLNWRVWLRVQWEAYSLWSIYLFIKKYSYILLITIIRFLPLDLRKKIVAYKKQKFG
ncbi:MAG: glycosyltransferase [Cyanobacteria bacterium]|jgi:glycosyltransferase involved in cell wall biosynthesis|nr:glycosyltransferase [Cyanobacteria bacterium GSL.Bin1]